jgi:hypothetical protein
MFKTQTAIVQVSRKLPKKGEAQRLDKNGLEPLIFEPLAGSIPSKRVISGTFAQQNYFEEGGVYEVMISEGATTPEYGRSFNFRNLGTIKGRDLREGLADLGNPVIVTVDGVTSQTPTSGTIEEPAGEPEA